MFRYFTKRVKLYIYFYLLICIDKLIPLYIYLLVYMYTSTQLQNYFNIIIS